MEENKKEETKDMQEKKKLWELIPVRSCMLMCLGGLYILYMGYRLCKNVINGVEGGGVGFFIVGVAFLVVGAGMLYVGIRGVLADDKKQKAEAAAAKAAAEKAEELSEKEEQHNEEAKAEEEPKETRKMSIKDRANLAGRLAEEESEVVSNDL